MTMRVVLIESGGFVGTPVRYEVDVSAIDAAIWSALEQAVAAATGEPRPPLTSAGGLCIRVERDDGGVSELTLSYAAPAAGLAELADRLRACAKPISGR